jgi:hypothetical protein
MENGNILSSVYVLCTLNNLAMKKILELQLILLLVIFSNQFLFSQSDTIPLSLTKKIFGGELKNYKSYLATEIIDQDFDPKKISKKSIIKYETILNKTNKTVIAVSIADKVTYTDVYLIWIKNGDWKLKSIRSLWLPAMYQVMLGQFRNQDEAAIKRKYDELLKSAIESDTTLTEADALKQLGDFDEFKMNINMMNLTVSPDKELIEHFNKNKDKFYSLLEKIKKENADKSQTWKFDNKSIYKTDISAIKISSITNFENPKIIRFTIGGMSENFTGYFYCENPSDLPEIESKGYIMIRPLGNGWYLFKTT